MSASTRSRVGNSRLRPYESLYKHFLWITNSRKIACSITFEDFLKFTQIKECFYCQGQVNWTERNLKVNGMGYNLDRKNNDLGYTLENSVVCCKSCNRIKGNFFTHDEFLIMMQALLSYRSGKVGQ